MKKSIAIILLGSALLLPNNSSVEASYSDKAVQVQKVEQINCVAWDGKQYDFKNLLNKQFTNHSFYFNWIDFVNKYTKSPKPTPTKPAEEVSEKETPKAEAPEVKEPEVEETPKVEETPEVVEKPEVEQAPEAVEKPEVEQAPEQTPEKEQVPEKPSTPEAAPTPTVPAPTPEKPAKPVEEAKPNASISAIEQEVLNLTNAERQKAGLAPLQIDQKLMDSARAKSKDMSVNRYFSHTSPTYGSPFDQMKSFGVTYRSAAENIAMGQRSAQEVVKAWMESPGHRQNILTPNFTHIGIGYDANGNYWTQQFIQK
ncbi:CAP domain-containing protein [Sporosarcina pasteurii]|uniref:Ribonucleases G and E n=1 Tax=Sporosarcina pasteurii TaxID=1474 RepID=A0A380BSI7_SPOPA|nr:CAP domain-containing protein [Sporosarcina pasteurii]MDS9471229.1 CAP domain-containing protein [Sporosarcina pasteurii]QBQ05136.1 hypothetical protein E2C16_05380 [Sporosarcina pasteurii]SUJ05881.1 Ribonucleases G and E [Sporosarcina pasteurii]